MSEPEWGDHFEHRLTMAHAARCDGMPAYEGGTDQRPFCADGCISFNDGDFHLPVGKLKEFVSTLYEAAGLPVPVILRAPTLPPGICHYSDGVKVFADGAEVRLQATESRSAKEYWHTKLKPAAARKLAANIAALADFAEAQPDPAEVEELAEAIRTAHHPDSGRPGDGDRTAARAALRWFREKRHGGES
jgi:hypothetical protein